MTTQAAPEWRVVEHDNMTGAERDLDNYNRDPWTPTFTRQEAEESVAWREANITNRYSYRIVPADPDATAMTPRFPDYVHPNGQPWTYRQAFPRHAHQFRPDPLPSESRVVRRALIGVVLIVVALAASLVRVS